MVQRSLHTVEERAGVCSILDERLRYVRFFKLDYSEETSGNAKQERLLIVVVKAPMLEEYEPVYF